MFAKLKVVCLHSLTIAWGYCLALAGVMLQIIDMIADPLSDPDFRAQIGAALGDTKIAGRILLAISVITIAARLRSLRRGS